MVSTDVPELLRYTYATPERPRYLLNAACPTYRMLQKVKKPIGGRGQFILPIVTKNAGVWSGTAEGGTIPTAIDPDTAQAVYSLQEFVGVYKISWKLLQDARTDKFALQQVMTFMDEGFTRRFSRNLNADLIGSGLGELFRLPAADDQTEVTVSELPSCEVGQVIDLMDASDNNTKLADSVTVNAVDPVNLTVTLSGAPSGTAAGDYGVVQDTVATAYSYHTNGLIGIIDDADPAASVGDYGGIDRSTAGNEYWEAYVNSNGGVNRTFTEDIGMQLLDGMREKSGATAKAFISNLKIGRRYHDVLRAEAFYALGSIQPIAGGVGRPDMGSKPAEDGKSPYNFGGVTWYFDEYFRANTIIALDTDHFFLGVGENDVPQPISKIFAGKAGLFTEGTTTTFDVRWYFQCELISDNPAAGAKAEDIAES